MLLKNDSQTYATDDKLYNKTLFSKMKRIHEYKYLKHKTNRFKCIFMQITFYKVKDKNTLILYYFHRYKETCLFPFHAQVDSIKCKHRFLH